MIASSRSCFLTALALCLCSPSAGLAARGDVTLASIDSVHSSRTAATQIASHQSFAPSSVDPPPEITTSPRLFLIYIPYHVSEPASHIAELCDCTFRLQPWRGRASMPFDVLLSISGRESAGNEAELKGMLNDAVASISPRPRVFVEFVQLKEDRYVHDVDEDEKNNDWVGGPNTAFYDAFLDGHIFRKYVSHYTLVQQMETDVCALKDGWLNDLIKPATNESVLISGATVKGDCIYVKKHDNCEVLHDEDDQMLNHVNGNALYRVGPDLTSVLTTAKATYGNAEPFDLAIYWVMKAKSMQARLHSNPPYFNMASLVDSTKYLDAAYYGGSATVVHVPRRLRTCGVRALATRGYVGLPLTVVVIHDHQPLVLARLLKEIQNRRIDRYVLMATSERVFAHLSKAYPFRVIPAFGQTKTLVTNDRTLSSADDTKSKPIKFAGPSGKPTSLWPTNMLQCEPWVQHDASPTGVILTIAARLVRMGYSLFFLDQRAVIFDDYELSLFHLPPDGVYVTKQYATWKPARDLSASKPWPPLIFFPRSELVAALAESAAAALVNPDAPTDIPQLKTFAFDKITDGGPFNDLSFPLALHRTRLVSMLDAKMSDYEVLLARKEPVVKLNCSTFSVAAKRMLDVRSVDIARVVRVVEDAVSFARAQSLSCIVLPSFVFEHQSAASIFKIVDSDYLTELAGNVTLVPSMLNIDTDKAVYVELKARHDRKPAHAGLCRSNGNHHCVSSEVRLIVNASKTLLGTDFVCARSVGVGLEDNAFVLRKQLAALKRGIESTVLKRSKTSTKVFVRGMWRHLPEHVWQTATSHRSSLITLAHVRRAMNGSLLPSLAMPLGQGDSLAFDDAWADLVESAICSEAKAPIDVDVEALTALGPVFLSGMSPGAVENDLAEFAAWLRRPDRRLLRGPFLVIPAPVHADNFTCNDWARAAKSGMLLGYAAKARHIVLPPTHDAWRASVNISLLHEKFESLVPTTVSRLLQPRLTFEALFENSSPSGVIGGTDRDLTAKYASQLAFVERTRRSTSKRSVLWTANITQTLHDAMRLGLRSGNWIVVREMEIEDADLEYVLRLAVAKSDDGAGFTYVRRVDAAFDGVCGRMV